MQRAGANASFADLAALVLPRVKGALSGRLRRTLSRRPASPEVADLGPVRETMRRFWKEKLGVTDATVTYFLRDAFDYSGYEDAIERCRRNWGSLQGKRVLDVGCGWGGLSLLLAREGADVSFVDMTPEHLQVTRTRVPSGHGYLGDACDLTSIQELHGPFDYVFVHSLIEHVAPPPEHRGEAAPTMNAKRDVLQGIAKLLSPQGRVFLSTGNFRFPLDGEIKFWFFHWLNQAEQRDVLTARGIDADRYGLFRWPELAQLATEAGLDVEKVETSPTAVANTRFLLTLLSAISSPMSIGLPKIEIEQLVTRVSTDPDWMPIWFAFFRRRSP